MAERTVRVVVAKPGLDGHDRGAKIVARALREALAPDGLNMVQANGAAAFQSVPHFHLHLIPRWANDGKGFDWKLVPGDRDQITKTGERLRALLR